MKIALLVFFVLCLIILAVGYVIFIKTLDRRQSLFDMDHPDFENPKSLMYPTEREHYDFTKRYISDYQSLPFETVQITSFDGLKLTGYLLEKPKAKESVILVHGYRSDPCIDFGGVVEMLKDRECNILALDNRAHGKSEGRFIGFGEHDQYDVLSWCDYLSQRFENTKIVLMGISMGGATVIHCANKAPNSVVGVIDDCGFTSIREICKSLIQGIAHLPYIPFGLAAELWAMLLASLDFKASDGREEVKNAKVPICFIHGLKDQFVSPQMSKEMAENCASEHEVHWVEKAGHAACYAVESENYKMWINTFIDRVVKEEKA